LKKQRLSPTDFSSPLSDVEVAAISLTNLQHATPIRGPVYDFLNTPLLGTPVWPSPMEMQQTLPILGHQNLHMQQHFQSKSSIQTRHSRPSPMEMQQTTPTPTHAAALPTPSSPASTYVTPLVAATKISPSRRFFRANRGRCNISTTAAGTATSTAGHIINQEECRVRPPPNP
jgi:hypothetical protein